MNYLVSRRYEECLKATSKTEKVVKSRYCIEFVIIYYAIGFYCQTRSKKLVTKNLVNLIQIEFQRKSPLVSSWVKLLKYSISCLNINQENFNREVGENLQKVSNFFLPEENQRPVSNNPSLTNILSCFLTIRNKGFGHTTNISNENVKFLLKNNFDKISLYLHDFLSKRFEGKLLLSSNISKFYNAEDYDQHVYNFIDFSVTPRESIHLDISKFRDDGLFSNQFYFYFDEVQELVSTIPFFHVSNESYFHYTQIDGEGGYPTYNDILTSTPRIVQKNKGAFQQLIGEDQRLLIPEIKFKLVNENNIWHNLPEPTYEQFIGRDETIHNIQKALKHRRIFVITVSGIGGVGKSTVTIKTIRNIVERGDNYFNYIVWVSAKKTYLRSDGIETEKQTFTDLSQLIDLVINITGFEEFLNQSYEQKKHTCLEILSMDSFLLIVDNFETIDNTKEFLDFFEEVGDYSQKTKVILTTRHQLGTSEKVIDLREFPFPDYSSFVEYLYNTKFKLGERRLKEKYVKLLYEYTGGLPLATEFFIGQCSKTNPLSTVLNKIRKGEVPKDAILNFSFKESFSLLNRMQRNVLFSIAVMGEADIDRICFVSNIEEWDVEDMVSSLKKYSFVNEKVKDNDTIFSVLPLTKIFLQEELSKLEKLNKELTTRYKELEYISSVQDSDTNLNFEINIKRDNLALNFAQAGYSSAKTGDNEKSEIYFKKALEYDSKLGSIWYYKALAAKDFQGNLDKSFFSKAMQYAKTKDEKYNYIFEYAVALFYKNEYDKAIKEFKKLKEPKFRMKATLHFLGKSYYETGRQHYRDRKIVKMKESFQQSLSFFNQSLYLSPISDVEKNHNTIGYYYAARMSMNLKNYNDADLYINNGLHLQPYNHKLIYLRKDLRKSL